MSAPNINAIPSKPNLKDLLDYWKKDIKLDLTCHHVGTVKSFNALNQTATAMINYTKTFQTFPSVGGTQINTPSYPQLVECPVICLGGGPGYLTFPIASGDECLILFNDRDFDNWFAGSSSSPPNTNRLHSFADAIILVGVRSMPNVLVGYDQNAVTLANGSNNIKISSNKIIATMGSNAIEIDASKIVANVGSGITVEIDATGKIKITNASGELIAALNQLFIDIQNGLVTTMLGPEPLVMPTFATDLALFQTFKA